MKSIKCIGYFCWYIQITISQKEKAEHLKKSFEIEQSCQIKY